MPSSMVMALLLGPWMVMLPLSVSVPRAAIANRWIEIHRPRKATGELNDNRHIVALARATAAARVVACCVAGLLGARRPRQARYGDDDQRRNELERADVHGSAFQAGGTRWSVDRFRGVPVTLFVALIAWLPNSRAMVFVGPPLFCSRWDRG